MDIKITLTGTHPLVMHNSRLANPLDPCAKAMSRITGKRKKTDADWEELARLEHGGSLYIDPEIGPYMPAANIWRSLYDGALKHKLGEKIKSGLFITSEINPLVYATKPKTPRTADALYRDANHRLMVSVKVRQSRVMRCRPIFQGWKTDATGFIDTNVLDFEELLQCAETAGMLVGIGDYHPRYGRYEAVVEALA